MTGMEMIIDFLRDILSNGIGAVLLFIFFLYPAFIILRFLFVITMTALRMIFTAVLGLVAIPAGIGQYIIDELKPENRKAGKIATADRRERRRKQEEEEKAKRKAEKVYKLEHKDELKAQEKEKKRIEKTYNKRNRLNALEKSNYKYFLPVPGHPDGPMGPDYSLRCKMEKYRKGSTLSEQELKLIADGMGFDGKKFGGEAYGEAFWKLYEWRLRKNEWEPTKPVKTRNGNRMADRVRPQHAATNQPNVVAFKPKRK